MTMNTGTGTGGAKGKPAKPTRRGPTNTTSSRYFQSRHGTSRD